MSDRDDLVSCVIFATGAAFMGFGLAGYAAWRTGMFVLWVPAALCAGWLAWTGYVFARHWPRGEA